MLQIVMQNDLDVSVRQAGVIYMKNMITQNWQDREQEIGQPIPFAIHEQDRAMIRDSICEAIVLAPETVRYVKIALKSTQRCRCLMF